MKDRNLNDLKNEYLATPIPKDLDFAVRKALKEGRQKNMKKRSVLRWLGVATAALALFTATVNISPALAESLAEVPGMKNVIKVLTFNGFTLKENNFQADLKVPVIDGLKDKSLQSALNEKYLEENKKLYENFMAEIAILKEQDSEAHMGIDTGYEIKTDNDQIFSIGRYVLNIAGSSSTVYKFDTIDKKNQVLITLPSLFKDEQYITIISEYIKEQMRQRMAKEEGVIFWVEGADLDFSFDPFEQIAKDQNFYINSDGKLVTSFNKYEVAPGYMGVIEFVIPTDILAEVLVSNEYLR